MKKGMKRYSSLVFIAWAFFLAACTSGNFDRALQAADSDLALGNEAAAVAQYERIINKFEKDPRTAAVMIKLAHLYYDSLGDADEARDLYGRVVSRFPMSESARIALEGRADMEEKMQDFEGAIEDYTSLLKYYPEHVSGYRVLLAGVYMSSGNYVQARVELAPLFVDKGTPEEILETAAFTHAESYFLEGSVHEAIAWFEAFLREFPNSHLIDEAKVHLATCLEETGKLGLAEDMIKSAKNYPNKKVVAARLKSIDERGGQQTKPMASPKNAPKSKRK
jgi:TolA-binding protein